MNDQQTNSDIVHSTSNSLSPRPAWRTELEIDSERQKHLIECLAIRPDVKDGIYPFKDVRLTRADIEWLLVTYGHGRDPSDGNDTQWHQHPGLDLRGADLRHVNLSKLPLARICGGLNRDEWHFATLVQRDMAGVRLEKADLSEAQLEATTLRGAHLEGATLRGADLRNAVLYRAHLEGAYLRDACLESANLIGADLRGAYLREAHLGGTDLRNAVFDSTTYLESVTFGEDERGPVWVADVHWNDVNLSAVDWTKVKRLSDEYMAYQPLARTGVAKEKSRRLEEYRAAARANRQLANAMRAQGMNQEAVPFAYRAQVLERKMLWRQMLWGQVELVKTRQTQGSILQSIRELLWRALKFGAYVFSWLLDILAGYGYKPGRSVFIYLLVIVGFATCYYTIGHLSPPEALLLADFTRCFSNCARFSPVRSCPSRANWYTARSSAG